MTFKRTLTLALACLSAPLAAQDTLAPQPLIEAERRYETVSVVLSTSLGEITIALETERAPITAGNFLRYVEEGRFDGTLFYRALGPKGEEPSGLIQGGTQFDPERILDPIAHESTADTGLSHTDGAISMARYEPGTATGDFSIMIGDQRGLDARAKAETEDQKLGYAVFGYVTDGMDVIRTIHSAPIDPDKGEGWMKGQMIAQPVVITEAKRAPNALDPQEPAVEPAF